MRTKGLRVSEVPFEFGERFAGETKASVREGMRYFGQLFGLRFGELTARFGRFGVVGPPVSRSTCSCSPGCRASRV